jgi:transposase, IS5 family
MQKLSEQTDQMLLCSQREVFDVIVPADHAFRKLLKIVDLHKIIEPLRSLYSDLGTTGLDIEKGFKALLIQFWEDYSDREMEKCLRENVAVKFFCGFGLTEVTPVHTYFTKLRARLGAKRLADAFNSVNEQLRLKGLYGDTFTFVDASSLITKSALWEERDRAIADGEEALNNAVVGEYAADPDARWGAKGKNNIWFGYKRHASVDMRYGLIQNVCVTPANVLDFQVLDQICPDKGLVFMDKLYDTKATDLVVRANGCTPATIRKNTNKLKNKDLDAFHSKLRMPFEGTFSKCSKRTRYRGRTKVLFQVFAESIIHNLKKAVKVLGTPQPTLAGSS